VKDEAETEGQHIHELEALRQKVAELETCLEQRKRAEEELRRSESKYRFLYQESPSISLIIGKDGLLKDANKTALETFGYSNDEIVGKHVLEFVVPEHRQKSTAILEKALRDEYTREIEVDIYAKDGSIHTILFSSGQILIHEDGSPTSILVTGIDITPRKQAEEEINKLLATIEIAKEAINITSADGTIMYTNDAMDELFGYEKGELIGKSPSILNAGTNPEELTKSIIHTIKKEGYWEGEIHNKRKDGADFMSYARISALKDENGRIIHYLSTQHDITDRKRAEEELRETRDYCENLFNYANAPIIVWNPSFTITRFNRAFEHLTGHRATEVVGQQLDILFPEDKRKEAMNLIRRASAGERWEVVEIPILHTDGTVKIVLWNSATLYAEDGTTPSATIAQGQDITERKRVEKQIMASLREKEILLREIHHRVKNNLQIISALLNLQSKHAKDNETLEIFRESQNRIKSMALIHDQLYQFKDLAKINMAEYIQKLTTDLFYSYGVGRDRIELKLNAHDVLLGVNTAIPCGLVINELVSNSLKHAFQDRMKGEICIDFRSNNHAFTLIVSDSGVGFPRDLDFRNTETLGLELVITLVEQLKGTIELDRSTGTTFKITFEEL
jgi:PAS domain S-box-containing protein